MSSIVRSQQAESDLEEILTYLNQFSPPAADRFAKKFESKCQLLSLFPQLGRARPEIREKLRSVVVDKYILYYTVQGKDVCLLRVLHGKRDASSLLKND